jgi:hypothetical protein
MQRSFVSKLQLLVCAAAAFCAVAQAADSAKPNVNGTWIWTQAGRGGGEPRKFSLVLKLDGDKLTGKLTSPAFGEGEPVTTEITKAKLTGEEVSFEVTREFNGNSRTTKYMGKVSADAIKGKIERERQGEVVSTEWEAKREAVKAEAK